MTKDDIINLARNAGCVKAQYPMLPWRVSEEALERFANLVAAAEREECAQIVDDFGDEWMCDSHMLSKQIRARSQS